MLGRVHLQLSLTGLLPRQERYDERRELENQLSSSRTSLGQRVMRKGLEVVISDTRCAGLEN